MLKLRIWKYKDHWFLHIKGTAMVYNTYTWGMARILAEEINNGVLPYSHWLVRPRTNYGNGS